MSRIARARRTRKSQRPSALVWVGVAVSSTAALLWAWPKPLAKVMAAFQPSQMTLGELLVDTKRYYAVIDALPAIAVLGALLVVLGSRRGSQR